MRRAANNTDELWLPVVGYENLYHVSSLGRIKGLKKFVTNRNNGGRVMEEKIITGKKRGLYLAVILCKDGILKAQSIHRIVASAFLANIENFPVVNHKDGNKHNNAVENLEWCTMSHNIKHAFATGLKKYVPPIIPRTGSLANGSIAIKIEKENGETVVYGSIKEAANDTGLGWGYISKRLKGVIKRKENLKIKFSYA